MVARFAWRFNAAIGAIRMPTAQAADVAHLGPLPLGFS